MDHLDAAFLIVDELVDRGYITMMFPFMTCFMFQCYSVIVEVDPTIIMQRIAIKVWSITKNIDSPNWGDLG